MNYNFEETDIINEIYNSYLNKNDYKTELQNLIYEIIIYNDKSNIDELVNKYGGIYHLTNLFNVKYKSMNHLDLPYIDLLAFIGLYDYIYNKVNEMIIENFDLKL